MFFLFTDFPVYNTQGFRQCMCIYFKVTQSEQYQECLDEKKDHYIDPCQWYYPLQTSPTSVTYDFIQNVGAIG